MTRRSLVFLFATTVLVPQAALGSQDSLSEALTLYRQNRVAEALPLFEAAAQTLQTADAYAWLGEAARRAQEFERAERAARAALSIDDCHSFALLVLGEVLRRSDRDSAWEQFSKAAECDSSDGNVWTRLWTEAIDRGDSVIEERALRRLMETNFLSPSVLAFNRWMLEALPDSALLVTNGDMDTYPALALQLVEGVRRDVAVVNRPMLNLRAYVDLVSSRYGVSLPRLDDSRSVPEQVIRHWRSHHSDGELGRQLVLSPTTEREVFPDGPGTLQFAGAFWRIVPADEPDIDSRSMVLNLDAVNGSDFVMPEVSEADRSAVRMAAAQGRWLTKTVLLAALRYAGVLIDDGRQQDADAVFSWAERYVRDAERGAEEREWIEVARARR